MFGKLSNNFLDNNQESDINLKSSRNVEQSKIMKKKIAKKNNQPIKNSRTN